MLIKEIMTHNTVTCDEQKTLNDAAQQMWDSDVGAMPVVNAEGIATGMITDRDICMAGYTQGRLLSEIPVSAAMSSELHTVTASADLKEAERLMRENQIRRLPVVDGEGRPMGIVSLHDLAQSLGTGKNGVAAQEIAETLRDVSRPRGTPLSTRRPRAVSH